MSSGHFNDITSLAWMTQPPELPATRRWHDPCWLDGQPQVNFPSRTLLKLSFSYFLHPSNSLGKEDNMVSADNAHLRPITAYFSAIFRLWPYCKSSLFSYLEVWVGIHWHFLPDWESSVNRGKQFSVLQIQFLDRLSTGKMNTQLHAAQILSH